MIRMFDYHANSSTLLALTDHVFQRWKRYLRWRRRRPRDYFEYPPLANLPEYPKWAIGGHREGFYVAYTRLGTRYFSIGMHFNGHQTPPYRVEIEEWSHDSDNSKWVTGINTGWSSLRQHDCATLADAEALIATWETQFETVAMEHAL